jgi:cephalosporin hydroxylase
MTDTFEKDKVQNIQRLGENRDLFRRSIQWIEEVSRLKYSYHFTWLGRPIIQFPQDVVAMQEIIWRVRPDLVIETGVARGGSMVFYASMLELLGGDRLVVGVDIEIRPHNREEIEKHPLAKRIRLIEGSSINPKVAASVQAYANRASCVLVVLDSLHTHAHVAKELELYSPLVTRGSYLVVFDTVVEFMPKDFFPDRPWGPGNNPYTAVREFLKSNDRFVVDEEYDAKLLISVAPGGYLKCVKD